MKPKRYINREKKHKADLDGGVYFLLRGNKIVYIGQSSNCHARCNSHNSKNWDRVRVIKCRDKERRIKWERFLLNKYRPEYNIQIPSQNRTARYFELLEFRRWMTAKCGRYLVEDQIERVA